ncbi:CAAX farnesyltransferase (FTase) subunit beta [Xylographa carneopallida]|nr:CAAX farnesyltransferase (FTase) subunit beta [Xylographa carneopallida]
MPIATKPISRGRRRKVIFHHNTRQTEHASQVQDDESTLSVSSQTQELGAPRAGVHDMASQPPRSSVPHLFRSSPPIQDALATETSIVQEETVQECIEYLTGTHDSSQDLSDSGLPRLQRDKHIKFLQASLEILPDKFVGYDASRPWIVYWALNGLTLLGSDISQYRQGYTSELTASKIRKCIAKN